MASINILQILRFIGDVLTIVTAVFIIMDESKNSTSKISWLLFIFVFRWVGVLIWVLIGINWKKRRIVQQRPEDLFGRFLAPVLERQQSYFQELNEQDLGTGQTEVIKAIRLLLSGNSSLLTLNNRVTFLFDGRSAFDQLLDDLRRARDSIHMEFYIWRSDSLGEIIKDILIERASTGVEVKLIFDGIGSFGKISFAYRRELKEAGIDFAYFLDLNAPYARFKINYRNHRKVIVIDGRKAYTGGMNIGQEYIDGGDKFETWRDSALRITGDLVMLLQALFLVDWASSGNELLLDEKFFPAFHPENRQIPMQLAFSGPDSRWPSIEQLFFHMITNATREVWIQSPYFIPSDNLLMAMKSSALSGVHINIMMTGVPDKRIPFWTAQGYFEDLLEAGVKIYQYNRGFLHSKFLVSDEKYATLGSCNMDMRSLFINFEVNAVMFDESSARKLTEQFHLDREHCHEITLEKVRSRGVLSRLRSDVLKIFSPIM